MAESLDSESVRLERSDEPPGLSRTIAVTVAKILKEDPRSRGEISKGLSVFLGEEVTKQMLDAYASESRDNYNMSAARFLGLVAYAGRWDALDGVIQRFSTRIATPTDVDLVMLGAAVRSRARLDSVIESFSKSEN